ncbi:MAG: SpoIIE family protein phosphatase [Candidatus Zixiibacteriota bacterium]|nr:MAG: SpoIIE family protein phosphatase [candidate division Zixibacteria bacterium]
MKAGKQHPRIEKLLLEAARMFNSTLEYEELTEMILKLVATAVNAEAALLFRVDHDRSDMKIRFMNCAKDCQMKIYHWELGQGVVGWVAQYKEPVIINDAGKDERVDDDFWKTVGIEMKSVISVPLIGRGHMIGVMEAINSVEGAFDSEDVDVLVGLANQIAIAVDNANLYRQAKRDALQKNLLYEIGKKLSSSLSLNAVLKEIMSSLKQAIDYTAGGIFIVDAEHNTVDSIYIVGYEDCTEADVHLKFGQGLVGHVANTGEPVIVSVVSDNKYYIDLHCGTKSEIVVPIKLDGRVIGVFNIESNVLGAYDQGDLLLMTAFASQAAISIERARLHDQLLSTQKLQEQLNIAREIQQTFLPKGDLEIEGYDIVGENISSGEVGGDYYDFIRIVDRQIGVAIADVSGKGVPASLLMASFRASLIAEIRNNYSIRTICEKANALLCESVKPGNFVTGVYGVLDAKNHVLTFTNFGHNLPVLLRADGEMEFLREGGPVMGVTPSAVYEERPLYIAPGDVMVFYTDGVVEVFNEKGEEFGLNGLVETVKRHGTRPACDIRQALYDAVHSFAAPDHIFDDLTMIVLKRTS